MDKDQKHKTHNKKNSAMSPLNIADQIKIILASPDNTKRLIGTLLFALPIIIVFVFFGVPRNQFNGGANAAQVNKVYISFHDFTLEENRIQKMQEYYAQLFGQPITFDLERQKMMRRQAIESLVQRELLSQVAEEEGFVASDKEVFEQIKSMNEFKKDGVFQSSQYFQLLEANNLTPAKFENSIRKQIQGLRTRDVFELAVKPSAIEVEKMRSLKSHQWNVQFVKFDKDDFLKNSSLVSSDDIKKALSQEDFKKRSQAYFEANKTKYDIPEKVSAQVITANFTPGNSESEKKALEKINQVTAKIKTMDFGQLAQKYSDDVGTKSKKGDLGLFSRGEKEPGLEQKAFAMKRGEVSEPIKGFSSYQIIKVNDKIDAINPTFDMVQNKVASELLGRDMLDKSLVTLEEVLKTGKIDDVNKILSNMKINWEETGWFNLDAAQIPKLAEKDLKTGVFQLSPRKRLRNQFLNVRNVKYILYLKDMKIEEPKESAKNEFKSLAQQRASQFQEDWIQFYRKDSKIEINPIVYQ